MNASAFDQKTAFPNQDNFKWTFPSEEELKLQIEQLEGQLHDDRITLKRLIVGVAYLTPFFLIILFAIWLAWH
jgi:hypothetical protein